MTNNDRKGSIMTNNYKITYFENTKEFEKSRLYSSDPDSYIITIKDHIVATVGGDRIEYYLLSTEKNYKIAMFKFLTSLKNDNIIKNCQPYIIRSLKKNEYQLKIPGLYWSALEWNCNTLAITIIIDNNFNSKNFKNEREDKKMKKTNTKTFSDLLREYERQTINQTSDQDYTNALTDLATAVTYSVLNKCIDPRRKADTKNNTVSNSGQNSTMKKLKAEVYRDLKTINNIQYTMDNNYIFSYNDDGELITEVINKDADRGLHDRYNATLGDGLDLVHDSIVAILEEAKEAKKREAALQPGYLEKKYTVRRLNRKVWIKKEDTVGGWETVETTPIQEIYRSERRCINNNRSVQIDPKNGYTYLEDYATDNESGSEEVIYRRYGKYADIGGYVTDCYNKKRTTVYTGSKQIVNDIDELVGKMNLTKKQAKILELRIEGSGYKAIAKYLGVTQRAVAKTVQAIQKKAEEIGLHPKKK